MGRRAHLAVRGGRQNRITCRAPGTNGSGALAQRKRPIARMAEERAIALGLARNGGTYTECPQRRPKAWMATLKFV